MCTSLRDYCDTSDYLISHACYDVSNKKVIGKFKDETNGDLITRFIGLRPKLYTFKTLSSSCDIKNVKGVPRNVFDLDINYENYENFVYNRSLPLHSRYRRIINKCIIVL